MNIKLNLVLEKLKILIYIWVLEILAATILSFLKSVFELSNFFENAHDIIVVNIFRLLSFNWLLLICYLSIKKLNLKKCVIVDVSVYLICCFIFGLAVENNWNYIWGYSFVSNLISIAVAPLLFQKIVIDIYENKFQVWVKN